MQKAEAVNRRSPHAAKAAAMYTAQNVEFGQKQYVLTAKKSDFGLQTLDLIQEI